MAIILCSCIALFLHRYRVAMVQSARTSTAQAVAQVSNTVGSYLEDIHQAMELVVASMWEEDDQDMLLRAFLTFRPDAVAVTSYSESGLLRSVVASPGTGPTNCPGAPGRTTPGAWP